MSSRAYCRVKHHLNADVYVSLTNLNRLVLLDQSWKDFYFPFEDINTLVPTRYDMLRKQTLLVLEYVVTPLDVDVDLKTYISSP